MNQPPKPAGKQQIVIPSMDQPIPREQVLGPAAPDTNGSAAPTAGESEDFLAAVRERNEKRTEKKPEIKQEKPNAASSEEGLDPQSSEDTKPDLPLPRKADEDEEDPRPRKTKEESVGDLKRSLQAERSRATQHENRVRDLEEQLENYSGVDERLQEIETLKARVKQLEPLEKVFNIHAMPEFQAKIGSREAKIGTGKEIAVAYGVNPAVIDEAAKLTDRKQLNTYLSRQFGGDQLAVSDVREQILEAQAIDAEIKQIEASPEESKEQIAAMVHENQSKEREKAVSTIKSKQSQGWSDITNHYSTGKYAIPHFVEKPGDVAHTRRRDTILNSGAEEFGKVCGALANIGLKDLPAPIARSMASHYQLGTLAAHLLLDIEKIEAEKADLEARLSKVTNYTRPTYKAGGTVKGETKEPETTAARAEAVFLGAQQKIQNQQSR